MAASSRFAPSEPSRGIYVAPALGGDARLIARDGMARFSPGRPLDRLLDRTLAGRRAARTDTTDVCRSHARRRAAAGRRAWPASGDPVWSPDGTSLLVFGRQATSGEGTEPDWWWVPLDGGPYVRRGVYERLAASGSTSRHRTRTPIHCLDAAAGCCLPARTPVSGGTGECRIAEYLQHRGRSSTPAGSPAIRFGSPLGTTLTRARRLARRAHGVCGRDRPRVHLHVAARCQCRPGHWTIPAYSRRHLRDRPVRCLGRRASCRLSALRVRRRGCLASRHDQRT